MAGGSTFVSLAESAGGFVGAGAVVLESLGSSSGGINPPLLGTPGSPGLDFTQSEVAFFLASDV